MASPMRFRRHLVKSIYSGLFSPSSLALQGHLSHPSLLTRSWNRGLSTLQQITVKSPDDTKFTLNRAWLRDHCRCSDCFHPITKQRLANTFDVIDQPIHAFRSTEAGLEVTWQEATSGHTGTHISLYPWRWIQQTTTEKTPPTETDYSSAPKQHWSKAISKSPPTVSYKDVMANETAVLEWLENVRVHGFCFVDGVPSTPEDTEALITRISFIRHTHYGGFWDFTADLAHGDTAYTNLALGAHTDTTYFSDPCGLQIFHLLSHTEGSGGESLLVDGFRAASVLREECEEDWNILSRTRISTHAVGDSNYHYHARGFPILTTNEEGDTILVRYNNDDRSVLKLPPHELGPWYRALSHWNRILTDSESEYWVQLKPGTVVVIDNHRVLHGRAAFSGKRRMCGAYIGADDYMARLLSLRHGQRVDRPSDDVWDPTL